VRAGILLDGEHASQARDYAAKLNGTPEMAAEQGMAEKSLEGANRVKLVQMTEITA